MSEDMLAVSAANAVLRQENEQLRTELRLATSMAEQYVKGEQALDLYLGADDDGSGEGFVSDIHLLGNARNKFRSMVQVLRHANDQDAHDRNLELQQAYQEIRRLKGLTSDAQ